MILSKLPMEIPSSVDPLYLPGGWIVSGQWIVHLVTSTIVAATITILAKKNQKYGSFGGYEGGSLQNHNTPSQILLAGIMPIISYVFACKNM
jgi:hypothetical protein